MANWFETMLAGNLNEFENANSLWPEPFREASTCRRSLGWLGVAAGFRARPRLAKAGTLAEEGAHEEPVFWRAVGRSKATSPRSSCRLSWSWRQKPNSTSRELMPAKNDLALRRSYQRPGKPLRVPRFRSGGQWTRNGVTDCDLF